VFPVECIERFRQLLASLEEVLIIDDSRHLAFMEHADIFNAAVARFLKGEGSGADSR
jgi:pimeloyl-ACP methyl ester carboxylesterase